MRESRIELGAAAARHSAWLNREHDRLDARLASAFLQTVWGTAAAARREFEAFRRELTAHVKAAERRLFAAIDGLDAPTLALEQFEWKDHTRELQHALAGVRHELRAESLGGYESLGALRRAMRRHRHHEHHLLELAGADASASVPAEAFL